MRITSDTFSAENTFLHFFFPSILSNISELLVPVCNFFSEKTY